MPKRTSPHAARARPERPVTGEGAKRASGRKPVAAKQVAAKQVGAKPVVAKPFVQAAHTSTKGALPTLRELRSQARREAILSAALDEFSGAGYAATRLDDVARRAGVAKGTIYLYFADKETLFQELARSMLSPFVGNIEAFAAADIPFPKLIDALAEAFVRDVIGTRR
ncbi:MAG: helix-turn-helix domain-containing protein [Pseudorhodoplanes sp.]